MLILRMLEFSSFVRHREYFEGSCVGRRFGDDSSVITQHLFVEGEVVALTIVIILILIWR